MISTMSGSEAVAQAVRLARAVTGPDADRQVPGRLPRLADAVARNVISPPDRAYGLDPLSTGILDRGARRDPHRRVQRPRLGARAVRRSTRDRIAAVILEPIPHNVGALLPEPRVPRGAARAHRRQGALLIFDEVITGFRHALGGYQQIAGVTPDLTTFGKAMGNGYAVGGVGGSADVMRST